MNNTDRTMIARLEERIKNVQSDISEIKDSVKGITKCLDANELAITKIDTEFADHLKNHRSSLKTTGIVAGVISTIIAGIAIVIGVLL